MALKTRNVLFYLMILMYFALCIGQYPYNGNPYNGNPYNGNPYNGNPYNGNPHNGNPYYGNPHNGNPYYGNPYSGYPYNGYNWSIPYNASNPYGNNVNLASNKSHHFVLGCRTPPGTQLFRQIYKEPGAGFWGKVRGEVAFPPNGTVSQYTLTCIRVLDQYIDGNGGYATLRRGGIGDKKVSISLVSRRGKGFNFIVEIYGRL